MTLGKIERFRATMWQDFLVRAQFESFESARERIKLWIRYYIRQLGISRKTYYQWEKRALQGMMAGLEQQPPGRPAKETDPQLEALQWRVKQLEAQLEIAKQTASVRGILREMERGQQTTPRKGSKKNPQRLTSGKSSR
jgi:hypothetical protein